MKKLPHLPNLESRIYYSQNREDLIISAFFPNLKEGFYVDVGAYDPEYDSVTKLFYDKGWTGINIEPQADRYELFLRKRPKDTNINCGISSAEGVLKLRSYNNQGLSTFSAQVKKENENSNNQNTKSYKDLEVKVVPLKKIFDQNKVSSIQFMKVDVEGFENEVVKSNDWDKYRPEVLCIETNHSNSDWQKFLIEKGYIKVFFDGLNAYFVDSNKKNSRKLDYIKYIVEERGGGLRADDFEIMKYYESQLNHYKEITDKAALELKHKEYEKFIISEKLAKFQSIKYSIKNLGTLLKYRIIGRK